MSKDRPKKKCIACGRTIKFTSLGFPDHECPKNFKPKKPRGAVDLPGGRVAPTPEGERIAAGFAMLGGDDE